MENVVVFNNELSGLYDAKPPISKAKMASITKSAMRAIKFYKHVVQSVEKFILKCKPEYKVPGLYVIDSIVRQSRHQYGPDKDVFAPRFARNMSETFANLFRCAPEDKSRIVRVLNLWQKNNVFAPEVIQPIFDLADPSHPIYQIPPGSGMGSGGGDISSTSNGLNSSNLTAMDMSGPGGILAGATGTNDDKHGGLPDLSSLSHEKVRTMRQVEHTQHQQHHYSKRQNTSNSSTTAAVSSKIRDMHSSHIGGQTSANTKSSHYHHHHGDSYKYHKSIHEDYDIREIDDDDGDEDDVIATMGEDNGLGDGSSPPISSSLLDNNNLKQLLNDPNVLRQLQTLQNFQKFKQQEENQKLKLNEMRLQEEAFEKHLQNVLKGTAGVPQGLTDSSDMNKDVEFVSEQQNIEVINLDGNDSRSPTPDRDRYKRRRSSRSRSRSPRDRGGGRRRRSSRSRSPRSRSPRSSNRRRTSRDRERDRLERNSNRDKEREHERERRRKGLPDIRKEHLSVCSTTLWVGHLSKLVYQEELSDTFGEYGDIVSIDQIVPRGCAFIVMNRRQDAFKAMQALKSHKLQGRAITISWAAGKGVKSKEWKDFWDLELGVTYIPWNKLDKDTDLDSLEEGGMFDEDTMPSWIKEKLKNKDKNPIDVLAPLPAPGPPGLLFGIDTTQPPPGAPPNTAGPPPPMMGMVPPGQFSMAPPMSGPPHRMLGPMGAVNPMMMPNMVPQMAPPHPMMPPGMMPPGFPPITGPLPLGLPPGAQFPPPGAVPPTATIGSNTATTLNVSNDDQMDVEMELEDAPPIPNTAAGVSSASQQQAPNFNQPPPMFAPPGVNAQVDGPGQLIGEVFNRDRQRSGGGSRWGARDDENTEGNTGGQRWRENGGPGGNFNARNAPGGGPMGISPMEMNMPQRPDFMNDFDNRGPRGVMPGIGGQRNGDFFPSNINQNRFNQPTSLMQMRIPPPAAFNQRMGGPGVGGGGGSNLGGPMFVRNQGNTGGGGGSGGRQQGPGFYNPRNPFNDNQRGRGGNRVGGIRGRGPGGMGGGGNWSDDEDDGNIFKRRGGPGARFREREPSDERRGPQQRGGRSVANNRNDRDSGTSADGPRNSRNRRGSRDDSSRHSTSSTDESNNNNNKKVRPGKENQNKSIASTVAIGDTEEDWDRELQDYDGKIQNVANEKSDTVAPAESTTIDRSSSVVLNASTDKSETFVKPQANKKCELTPQIIASSPTQTTDLCSVEQTKKQHSPACTPLYDELPPPAVIASHTGTIVAATGPVAEAAQPVEESNIKSELIVESAAPLQAARVPSPIPAPTDKDTLADDASAAASDEINTAA